MDMFIHHVTDYMYFFIQAVMGNNETKNCCEVYENKAFLGMIRNLLNEFAEYSCVFPKSNAVTAEIYLFFLVSISLFT